jgi:TolB-like protein
MVSTRMPPPDEVRAHLRKVLASNTLAGSEQLRRLLEVVVERTANGHADTLKEYTIGVEAFGRPAGYDPKIDPIVRVQAGRLRTKLDAYYAAEGASDTMRITMPKGAYVPVFETRTAAAAPAPSNRTALILTLGAVLIVSGVAGLAMRDNTAATDLRSIAVLPLRNLADDPAGQAVADEATEALVTSLARNNALRVASTTTTRNVARTQSSLPDIAKMLHVRWVVEGAVGRENGLVLLKLRLVDSTSDRKIWADAFTTTPGEMSATQRRTAAVMADAIERVLAQPPRSTH